MKPIVTDADGRMVLVQFGDEPLYLLADPDLLVQSRDGRARQAAAALAMLDFLNSTDASDRLRRHPERPRPVPKPAQARLFDPPFLAVTLAIAAALLLAGLQAMSRFGPPRPRRAGHRVRQGGAGRQCGDAGPPGAARGDARRPLCGDDPRPGGRRRSGCPRGFATRRSTDISTAATGRARASPTSPRPRQTPGPPRDCSPPRRRCTTGKGRRQR